MKVNTVLLVLLFASLTLATNPACIGLESVRSFDGSCNNLDNPTWGAVSALFLRGPEGVQFRPFNVTDPSQNPRSISNSVLSGTNGIKTDNCVNLLEVTFSQFVTHDILRMKRTGNASSAAIPILASNDLFFNFLPSVPANPRINHKLLDLAINPEGDLTAINEVNSFLDLSTVYGNDATTNNQLRSFVGGKFLTQDYFNISINYAPLGIPVSATGDLLNYMPSRVTVPQPQFPPLQGAAQYFSAGEQRANNNLGLITLQLLFFREHNRLATAIAAAKPTWTDEQIFQAARKVNVAQYQHIIFDEWLESLLGPNYEAKDYKGYKPEVSPNPTISMFFPATAFAFGHTSVDDYQLIDSNFNYVYGTASLSTVPLVGQTAGPFLTAAGVSVFGKNPGNVVRSLLYSKSAKTDLIVNEVLRTIPFGDGDPNSVGIDTAALTIMDGYLAGIPNYATLREFWWNPKNPGSGNSILYGKGGCYEGTTTDPIQCFKRITNDDTTAALLQTAFKKVNKLDPFVGLLAEPVEDGHYLGKTLRSIIGSEFLKLRDGDRFYYENIMTASEIANIKSNSLADLVRRNFPEIGTIPENLFFVPPSYFSGPTFSCDA